MALCDVMLYTIKVNVRMLIQHVLDYLMNIHSDQLDQNFSRNRKWEIPLTDDLVLFLYGWSNGWFMHWLVRKEAKCGEEKLDTGYEYHPLYKKVVFCTLCIMFKVRQWYSQKLLSITMAINHCGITKTYVMINYRFQCVILYA